MLGIIVWIILIIVLSVCVNGFLFVPICMAAGFFAALCDFNKIFGKDNFKKRK